MRLTGTVIGIVFVALTAHPACQSGGPAPAGPVPASLEIAAEFENIPVDPVRYPYNHAASLVELPGGELLCAWGAGARELADDTVILLSRKPPDGAWTDPVVAADRPGFADANPVLFVDDTGLLWLIHVEMFGPTFCQGRVMTRTSGDGGVTWTEGRRLLNAACVMVRNKPIILSGGRWVLPAYIEATYASQFWLSDDRGETWRPTLPLQFVPFNHLQPAVVELSDGSLYSLARRAGPGEFTWQSRSFDGGRSWWSRPRCELPNPNSGLDLLRLASGELVAALNGSATERSPLSLAMSHDDGCTWSELFTLDAGPPDLAYPSLCQTTDSRIHVVYSNRLANIRHAVLDPDWMVHPELP